jgi:transcriptional regulator with XRE-family HTH domain
MDVSSLDAQAIGARVRELRLESEFKTHSALAREIGVEKETIGRIEAGRNVPTLETLSAIARACSTTLDWIALGRGPRRLPIENAPTSEAS